MQHQNETTGIPEQDSLQYITIVERTSQFIRVDCPFGYALWQILEEVIRVADTNRLPVHIALNRVDIVAISGDTVESLLARHHVALTIYEDGQAERDAAARAMREATISEIIDAYAFRKPGRTYITAGRTHITFIKARGTLAFFLQRLFVAIALGFVELCAFVESGDPVKR